jgi:hypothetical protein
MPSLKTIQLDFFGTPEEQATAPDAILIEVDSLGLEESEPAQLELYMQFHYHLNEGDSVQLLVSADAPTGTLRLAVSQVAEITKTRVLVRQSGAGCIPAGVFTYTNLDNRTDLPNNQGV